MEIRNLATFLSAAELQNFSKTAERLNYTQSTVTLQIQQLEKELGVKLFDRVGKKVTLTENGEKFIPHAKRILDSVNNAKNLFDTCEEPAGKLCVGVVNSLYASFLMPLLPQFHLDFPLIETTVEMKPSADLVSLLQQGEVDLIFFAGKRLYDHRWIKVMEEKEDVVFVVSSANSLAGQRISIADVLEEPLMLTKKGLCYRYDLEQFLASRNLHASPFFETCNPDHIISLLKSTNAVSFLPMYAVRKHLENGDLATVDVFDAKIQTCVQLIRRSDKTVTLPMEAFTNMVVSNYKRLRREEPEQDGEEPETPRTA